MARRYLPDADFFLPASYREGQKRRATVGRAREGKKVLHVSHGDCLDGACSDVMVRLKHGTANVTTVFTDPSEVATRLEWIAAAAIQGEGRSLLLSDVSPQVSERERIEAALGQLNELGWRIEWRDHHAKQWAHGILEAVRRKADYVRVDLDNHECGTSICQLDLLPGDAYAKELAAVVRDIDLWIRKDPRSDTLTDALHELGSQSLVEKLVRDRVVLDGQLQAAAKRHRDEFHRDLAQALAKARSVEGRNKVGVVYGDFPGSQACHELRQAKHTDVEINLKPDGKFSIRSRTELPFCHTIAQQFRGGGHPNASGGWLKIAPWEWPRYWATGRCQQADALAAAAAHAKV